jgi:ubiquinone/menaquinone biosynthesis C-methylase UbiE
MASPYPIHYLDVVTGTAAATEYKRKSYEAIAPRPGSRILDVGCGTGDDVRALGRMVAPSGSVVGVDKNPQMIAEAWRRLGTDKQSLSFMVSDAHQLQFADDSFDAVRCDRALQHMDDPATVVRELTRVARVGGRVAVSEPDWEATLVDCRDRSLTRKILNRMTDVGVRHGWIGRQLLRLFHEAGLADISYRSFPFVLTDFATADAICGFTRQAAAAAAEGLVDDSAAAAWIADLHDLDRRGIFSCCLVGFMAVGGKTARAKG